MMIRKVAWLLATMVLALSSSAAEAHDFGGSSGASAPPQLPPRGPCGPCGCAGHGGGGNGPQPPSGRSDNPISYFDGGESVTHVDLATTGEFPIVLSRTYDSQSTFDSPLGAGWSFTLTRALYEYSDGSIVVRYGCGSRDRYVLAGGTYVTPNGGMMATLTAQTGGYKLTYNNGEVDLFDSLGRLTSAQDARGNSHEYTYDSRGKLPLIGTAKAAVDPSKPGIVAYVHRITRIDEKGANGSITGRFVTFQYNEATGRLASVTANDGRAVSYLHDTSGLLTKGNLVQVTMLDGQVATYGYTDSADAHNLTSITEASGRTPVINSYDANDRVVTQTEGTRKIEFNYQVPFVRTIVTRTILDQNGANPYLTATTYEFDATGRITKITTPLGHEERYTYDASSFLTKLEVWQKDGASLSLLQTKNWTYDAQGHKLSETVALDSGETITKSWTYEQDQVQSEQVVSSAAPAKLFRTEYTFNYGADGRPISIQSTKRRRDDGSFQSTSFTYDSRNRLLTTTLPDGVKKVNEYTGDFVTHSFYELGGVELPQANVRFEYNAAGRLTKQWDARNNLTEFVYDDRGRLISRTNALNQQDIWTYTNDLLTQFERGKTAADGEGQVSKYIYDSRARLTKIQRKNDAGAFVDYYSFAYDSEDRRLSETDALSRTTGISYDLNGRVAVVTDPGGKQTKFFYDAANNRTRVRDALQQDVDFEFDDLNRIVARVQKGVSPNVRTEITYDAASNVSSFKDAENRLTVYQFDALSRNTKVVQPLGQEIQFVYDSRDRLDYTITARNQKLDFAYEAWGAIKEEAQYPSVGASTPDRTITYSYDNDGNVTSVADTGIQAGLSFSTTFDALRRPIDETIKYLPGGDRVIEHRYDRFGNRSQANVTGAGATSNTYAFDKLDRLSTSTLGGATISLGYYATDELQSAVLPNGVTQTFSYKSNGPVDSIVINGPTGQIAQFGYTYDDALNLLTQSDFDGNHSYTNDGLGRVTQATHPAPSGLPATESFTYTLASDRQDPNNVNAWSYDANHRIVAAPGLTYTHDAAGNMQTRSDSLTLTHDARQRLVEMIKSGVTSTYLYDPFGRRIKKTVASATTWFLWDGTKLIAEFDATGNRVKRYAYLHGSAPAQIEDSAGIYYVHSDRMATPRLLTNSAGQVVWRSRNEVYGKATIQEDPDANGTNISFNFRFPGQYFDAESGMHFNNFRTYDPGLGRYIESDPIGLRGGMNTYSYVSGSPTMFIDPSGLAGKSCWPTWNRYQDQEKEDLKDPFPTYSQEYYSWRPGSGVSAQPGYSLPHPGNRGGGLNGQLEVTIELWAVVDKTEIHLTGYRHRERWVTSYRCEETKPCHPTIVSYDTREGAWSPWQDVVQSSEEIKETLWLRLIKTFSIGIGDSPPIISGYPTRPAW